MQGWLPSAGNPHRTRPEALTPTSRSAQPPVVAASSGGWSSVSTPRLDCARKTAASVTTRPGRRAPGRVVPGTASSLSLHVSVPALARGAVGQKSSTRHHSLPAWAAATAGLLYALGQAFSLCYPQSEAGAPEPGWRQGLGEPPAPLWPIASWPEVSWSVTTGRAPSRSCRVPSWPSGSSCMKGLSWRLWTHVHVCTPSLQPGRPGRAEPRKPCPPQLFSLSLHFPLGAPTSLCITGLHPLLGGGVGSINGVLGKSLGGARGGWLFLSPDATVTR